MKSLFTILIFLIPAILFGQKHQWAKSHTGATSTNALDIDSSNNTYVAGLYRDSLKADSSFVGNSGNIYVSKINSKGQTEWISTLFSNTTCYINDVVVIHSNRILVSGQITINNSGKISLTLGQNDSLVSNFMISGRNHLYFIAEYDSLGKLIYYQKIFEGNSNDFVNAFTNLVVKDSLNNIYIGIQQGSGTVYTKNSNYSSNTTKYESLFIKYSSNFDSIHWIKNPVDSAAQISILKKIRIDKHGYLYFITSVYGFVKVQNEPSYHVTGVKEMLSVFNPQGKIVFLDLISKKRNNFYDAFDDVAAIDSNNIFIIGYVMRLDSLYILGDSFPKSPLYPDSVVAVGSTHLSSIFILKLSLNKVKWVRNPQKAISVHQQEMLLGNVNSTIKTDNKEHVYINLRYNMNYDIVIGGLSDSLKEPFKYPQYLFLKFDTLGNALWIKQGIRVNDMIPNNINELVYCGNYFDTVEFDPFTLLPQNGTGFVAKLMDYSITRGPVSAGPYCAGDSIYVPFTLLGEFDTANWFIAELSDEHGNFEQNFRELGRIKGNTDSVVVGTLPLFEVASSAKYRIRIRATNPAVQSFYWEDTLQLLIYSKDKADPGPQEFLCFGDSMEIQTYGGTKWEWSPNQFISDTTTRKTIVFPPQTSTYRIVISDSSGCGEADTAFKTIVVRQKPQIASPQTDFVVCFNDTLKLSASFSLGDSTNYINKWYLIRAQGWQLRKTGEGLLQDTFTYIASPSMPGLQRIALVHTDQCYPENDTLQFNVIRAVASPSPAILSAQDSLFCSQTPTLLTAKLPNRPKLEWHWLNTQGDTLKSGSNALADSLEVTPIFNQNQPETYRVVTINNCVGRRDTASITLNPREVLRVTPSTFDTLVCSGTELTLFAFGKGGDSLNYQFNWLLNDSLISTDSSVMVTPNSTLNTQNLKLILSDGCMPENDTVEVLINVRPELKAAMVREPHHDNSISDTTVCSGSELEFFAKGFGGDSSNYTYQWEATSNGGEWEVLGSDSVVTLRLSKGDNINMIRLIINDDCSPADTSLVTINVLPPLSVNLRSSKGDTVCFGEEIEFFAEPSGGNNTSYTYQWFVNDTLVSSDSTTKVTLRVPQGDNHGTQQIKLVLSDACTNPNDTFEQIIVVRPKLHVTLSGVEVCANPSSTLTAIPTGGNPNNYIIEWFDEDNIQIGTGETLIVTPNELTTYKVILTDGCSKDTAFAQTQIDRLPSTLTLSASPTEGCEPLEVEFHLNTIYSHAFSAKIFIGSDSLNIQNSTLKTFSTSPSNSTLVLTSTLLFTTQSGCSLTTTGPEITVHPKPIADFSFVPEEPSLDKPKVNFKNLSTGAISYQWNLDPFGEFTDFEPEVIYEDSGRFSIRLIAFSDQGCSDTLEGELFVKSPERMFIPTAFSPNGDGLNDVFEPKVRGYDVAEFSIFNRWGEKIFSSQGTSWDGTFNGNPAQIGVYTYTLLLVDEKGEKLLFTGTVSLMR